MVRYQSELPTDLKLFFFFILKRVQAVADTSDRDSSGYGFLSKR
jgi:hypothetical protein